MPRMLLRPHVHQKGSSSPKGREHPRVGLGTKDIHSFNLWWSISYYADVESSKHILITSPGLERPCSNYSEYRPFLQLHCINSMPEMATFSSNNIWTIFQYSKNIPTIFQYSNNIQTIFQYSNNIRTIFQYSDIPTILEIPAIKGKRLQIF